MIRLCACGCGQPAPPKGKGATRAACRKRQSRDRNEEAGLSRGVLRREAKRRPWLARSCECRVPCPSRDLDEHSYCVLCGHAMVAGLSKAMVYDDVHEAMEVSLVGKAVGRGLPGRVGTSMRGTAGRALWAYEAGIA